MAFNALGVLKNEGGEDEWLEVRDVRRAIAQTLKAIGAETGVGAGPRTELVRSVGEAVARPAVCTAGVMERLRSMARTCVVANAARNRQLSRGGASP